MTQFHEKFISWVHGYPNTGTNKHTGNFPLNFSATKIHGEFHSHIIMHTVTITNNSVFYTTLFSATMLLAKLPKTTTRGLLSV